MARPSPSSSSSEVRELRLDVGPRDGLKEQSVQRTFVKHDGPQFLFWRAGAGGAKTVSGVARLLRRSWEFPGLITLITGPSWDQLRDGTLATLLEWTHPDSIRDHNKVEHRLTFSSGSSVILRAVGENPWVQRAIESHDYWMDEAALCPQLAWDIGLVRARKPPLPEWPKTWQRSRYATTTPKGEDWTMRAFTAPDSLVFETSVYDNPHLGQDVIGAMESRYRGTPFYEQEMLGRYAKFEGLVYPQFSDASHVAHPPAASQIVRCVVGLDYGMVHPFAMVLLAEDRRGVLWQLDEFWQQNPRDEDWLDKLGTWCRDWPVESVECDPASPASFVPTLVAAGYPAHNAENDLYGIRVVGERLNHRTLMIAPGNPRSLAEFGMYQYKERRLASDDETRFEEKIVKLHDDLMDARRYAVMYLDQRQARVQPERRILRPSFLGVPA
jgi:hypothetical protein